MDELIPDPLINSDNEMIHVHDYNTMVHSNEIALAEAIPPAVSRGQKRKSAIWEHFTLIDFPDGCKRACCIHCDQTLAYSSGSKNSGTSHLTRHIAEWCRALKDQQKSRRYKNNSYNANAPFDQDRSRSQLAKMIIQNDCPLYIVKQPGFLSFVHSLQPNFKMSDVGTVETDVYALYQNERDNLQLALGDIPGRISLTVGSYTTSQAIGYISLTGQFMDSEWKLHRRVLNFMMSSEPCPQSENEVSKVISRGLSGWNIQDKLFSITLEHDCSSSSHEIYSENLRSHLSSDNTVMLKGQVFVVRCYATVLNAIAHDVLASINNVIYLIRESIKFLKADVACEEKFAEIAVQLAIPSDNTLCLDVTTQWNTTYLMLLAAIDYKQVFTQLESYIDTYTTAPSTEDWKKAEAACKFLKLLYLSAQNFSPPAQGGKCQHHHPTANVFFHDAWALQVELQNAAAHGDPNIRGIAANGGVHERFDGYWKDCNVVLAVAVAMDPRFKMKMVEFAYSKIYGASDAAKHVKVVDDAVVELYKEYAASAQLPRSPIYIDQMLPPPAADDDELRGNETASLPPVPPTMAGAGLGDFEEYLSEEGNTMGQLAFKNELELYMEEGLIERTPEFDVLRWWKDNTARYPMLSRMARDVLAVQMVSTAGSVFSVGSVGSRVLDDYRSSLPPQLVEAIFCAKDWLQYSA